MLRKTLTILSLIGLLLSVGLWGVSYWNIKRVINACTAYVGLSRGAVVGSGFVDVDGVVEWDMETMSSGFDGFATYWIPRYHETPHSWPDMQYTVWGFVVPLYIPLVASGLPLVWLLPAHRRRKRNKLGLCLNCGYDLRGSTAKCPECGQEFESHD